MPNPSIIISSTALIVAATNFIWNARTAWIWKREERESKRPYVIVQKLEWVAKEQGGELRITLKNTGARPARNIRAIVRMIDYHMQSRPAIDFDFYEGNDLAPGSEFVQSISWFAPITIPVSRVQALVTADDPLIHQICPPLMSYYMWGDLLDKTDTLPPNQPFRTVTEKERQELIAYLESRNDTKISIGKYTVLMLPEMPNSLDTHRALPLSQ